MNLPKNHFKAALNAGTHQLGIWNTFGGTTVAELLAGSGFDWILVDTEHSVVSVTDVLPILQTIAAFPDVSAVVRPSTNDPDIIKRVLDLGAQTLLIPYVQSPAEAQAAVDAVRYPPAGMRGVAGLTRATQYGRVAGYSTDASQEICLLLQVETQEALEQLEEIAAIDGVDGVFIGPSDLSASMGYPGQAGHPEVVAAIEGAFERLAKLGVPSGILTLNESFAKRSIELGTAFTAVGVDMALLVKGADALRSRF